MIFLRQTSYTNNNANNSSNLNRHERNRNHLRSANANRNRPNRHNNQNHLFNSSFNRPSPATIQPNGQPNLGELATSNHSSTNRELIRSVKINERLASIGGLFGILSIIITGALLYALFTGKSEDRWYYIIAVLINVSLLIILMFAAILFDRIYLRKLVPNESHGGSTTNSTTSGAPSSTGANRVVNVNPLFYPSVYVTPANLTSINDVPPRYPGYSVQEIYSNTNAIPINTTNQHTNNNSTVINLNNSLEKDLANPQRTDGTVCILSVLNEQSTNRESTSGPVSPSSAISSSSNSPPNYFDLYPVKNVI